jgi:hypothetical protein
MMLLGTNLRKNLFPAFHCLIQDNQRVVLATASGYHSGVDANHLWVFDLKGDVWVCDSNTFNAFLRSLETDINQLGKIT